MCLNVTLSVKTKGHGHNIQTISVQLYVVTDLVAGAKHTSKHPFCNIRTVHTLKTKVTSYKIRNSFRPSLPGEREDKREVPRLSCGKQPPHARRTINRLNIVPSHDSSPRSTVALLFRFTDVAMCYSAQHVMKTNLLLSNTRIYL